MAHTKEHKKQDKAQKLGRKAGQRSLAKEKEPIGKPKVKDPVGKKEEVKKRAQKEGNEAAKKALMKQLDKGKSKPAAKPKRKKLPGEGVEKTPAKMPDGYNMKRPAEKLGYIQKLGAGRMSPGKMGDLTAMKMMHGDAAAKYYDGAGMYMNGAPKYEGASKSYMGPGSHEPGHDDIPSYTKQTTTTKVIPGTSSSTSTSSSGGSSSSGSSSSGRTNFSSDPAERAKQKQWIKDNPEAYQKALADKKKKSTSTSSSSSSTSSKPTIAKKTETKKISSTRKTGSQIMAEGKEKEANRRARHKAGMAETMNIAKKDSANIAQDYLKCKKITPENLEKAVKKGNIAGKRVLLGYGDDRGSFGQQGYGKSAEFRYDRDDAEKAFTTNIGQATATSMGGRAKGRGKVPAGEQFKLNSSNYSSSDIGTVKDFSKKGQYKITDVKTDPGTAGSYGGFDSAKEYMDSMKGGTPKMPNGPMKFGMKK